ncbi:MAG: hypothetical protein ABIQ88_13445 [Chitinophagaceae bacterium]
MQSPDLHLSFLQLKIINIGTARFFCDSDNNLPFPAYIINAVKTDNKGYIWFFISSNPLHATLQPINFASRLEFYRKGYPYSLAINGTASLVNDRETVQNFIAEVVDQTTTDHAAGLSGLLLVKVKMEKATYRELPVRKNVNWFHTMSAQLKEFFYPVRRPQWQPSI